MESLRKSSGMRSAADRPAIVARDRIPVSACDEETGLEVRPFRANDVLKQLMPNAGTTLAWVQVRPGEEARGRAHSAAGLLIVLRGEAGLTGAGERDVAAGDVVTLPAGQAYGLCRVGAGGLHAVRVLFGQAPSDTGCDGLDTLLARNEERMQELLKGPFYTLFRKGRLSSARQRLLLRQSLRVFADAFQLFLFTRQSTCRDERFRGLFHQHLLEEIGHNELLGVNPNKRAATDPILKAASAWFSQQMLVLDNVDKAAINLVLETAGHQFGLLAGPMFLGDGCEAYFDTHAEADAEHKEVGMTMLANQHPSTYARLLRVLDKAWDMLGLVTTRIAALASHGDGNVQNDQRAG